MNNKKLTIDDMIFEDRNREYGSYYLRKRFHIRLLIGFISSLLFILAITLGYFWYLSEAGDENIYSLPSSNTPYLKTAPGNLLSPEELADLVAGSTPVKDRSYEPEMKKATPVQSFRVTENRSTVELKPLDELISNEETVEDDLGLMVNDSTALGGGFLPGDGFGAGGIFDRLPEFPGGDVTEYVEQNLRYPPMAIKQKIHGTVIVNFVISKTGHVTNVKIERGVNPIIDEEALKTIRNMPPWKPGMMHGKPINFLFRMPINFIPVS